MPLLSLSSHCLSSFLSMSTSFYICLWTDIIHLFPPVKTIEWMWNWIIWACLKFYVSKHLNTKSLYAGLIIFYTLNCITLLYLHHSHIRIFLTVVGGFMTLGQLQYMYIILTTIIRWRKSESKIIVAVVECSDRNCYRTCFFEVLLPLPHPPPHSPPSRKTTSPEVSPCFSDFSW